MASPLVPIVIVAAGVGAIALALRGKKSSTPDPLDVAKLYMKGAAGTRQFEVRRVGPGYAWTVKGSKEGSGSDTVSGSALVLMFEFLYSGNSADLVTGHVAKGSDEGLAAQFSVTREDATRWSWIVSQPTPSPAASLGSGDSSNRGGATIDALHAIEPYTDWIVGLPSLQGGGVGDPLEPDPTDPDGLNPDLGDGTGTFDPTIVDHGLSVSGANVAVYDLEAWLEYAAPIVADGIQADLDAAEIHDSLGLSGYDKFSGKTRGVVQNNMRSPLKQWDDLTYLELDNVQRVVAAAAVGKTISLVGKKGRVKGKPVITVRNANGTFNWYVWPPGNRRGTQFAMFTGNEYRQYTAWNKAVKAAAGPETGPGGGAPVGSCDEPSKSGGASQSLSSALFTESKTKRIQIFTPADASCHEYELLLGICLVPDGGGTFGSLDQFMAGLGEGDQPSNDPVNAYDKPMEWGIDRHPAYDEQMDWWRFEAPLAWKRQIRVTLSYIDGALTILDTDVGNLPQIDPCPDKTRRWPGFGDDHYVVNTWKAPLPDQHARETSFQNWTSQPQFGLEAEGKNLFLNIEYSGLPFFVFRGPDYRTLGAEPNKKIGYTLAYKTQSFPKAG